MRTSLPVVLAVAVAAALASADPFPVSGDVDWVLFRGNARSAIRALADLNSPLPAATTQRARELFGTRPVDPSARAEDVQNLLDPHCLALISINPESRVKAARGAAAATLPLNRPVGVLVKVYNEAGVTHPVRLSVTERWLGAAVSQREPAARALTGQKVEYLVLRLAASEPGKREAVLKFDVGQGTQDLGFRAELPVLFTVTSANPKTARSASK